MFRKLIILAILAFAPTASLAKDDAVLLCNGKYALAQEMLDAAYGKYGTIYTGGSDGSHGSYNGNDVGATIDLWRLWRGLPDLRFRDAHTFDYRSDWGWDFSGFGRTAEDFAIILRIAERPQATGLSEVYRFITARFLNSLVSAGSGPGWWLAPDSEDATERQKLAIAVATPGSLMEWLLVMQADSDTPDSMAWVKRGDWMMGRRVPRGLDTPQSLLRNLVSDRIHTQAGLEWQVAAMVTPAEYAVSAVRFYEVYKSRGAFGEVELEALQYLPIEMRRNAMANLAMQAVWRIGLFPRSAEDASARLEGLAALSPSPEFSSWLFVGRAWTAGSVDELIAFHDGAHLDVRSVDTLNLLALDDLAAFADKVPLPEEQHRMLVTVVATRAFVLGRLDLSRQYLTKLQGLMPDYQVPIQEALAGPGDDEVQVARAFLALPRPTVRLSAYENKRVGYFASELNGYFRDIDLPLRMVSAAILNGDLRSWMEAPPKLNGWSLVRRAQRRGRVYDDRDEQPFIPDEWQRDPGFPFLKLIAWDELGQLGTCHGLTNRLSEVLVNWVDRNSDNWVERLVIDDSAFPGILRRIVVLNRLSPGALINGKPAGQRAFALLKDRYPDSGDALATPYWFYEDQGCKE
jgi:hypothetical protein